MASPDDEGVYLENDLITPNTNTPSPNNNPGGQQVSNSKNSQNQKVTSKSLTNQHNQLTTGQQFPREKSFAYSSIHMYNPHEQEREVQVGVPGNAHGQGQLVPNDACQKRLHENMQSTLSSPNIYSNDLAFRRNSHSGSMMKLFDSFRSRKHRQRRTKTETSKQRTPRADATAWSADQVGSWFEEIDFETYAGRARQINLSGLLLLKATDNATEMERIRKNLKLANDFHKRKLELAARELFYSLPNERSLAGQLDNHWVVRWLDDIGLPQYRDKFVQASVDGRVLDNLSLNELTALGVKLDLHYSSIRRGIELVRLLDFETEFFIRRPEELNNEGKYEQKNVIFWSNHRVMEWLHSIDLSEYTTALRGSGIHGALRWWGLFY